jgi:hypothetical protein
MVKRVRRPYAAAAAAACGLALLVLVTRAGALRAGAMESGGIELAALGKGVGQLLQSSIAPTVTLEPKAYFPILAHNWFKEITANEDFDPPVTGWPEGSVRNTVDVHEEFNYGPFVDGDTSTVYQVGIRDNFDHVFVTGPLYVLKNSEYQAWMRRLSADRDQLFEYGILISPTPIDPAHPEAEGAWFVKKWDVHSLDDHPAETIGHGQTSAVTEGYKQWNQLRIRRVGNTLYFDATHGNSMPGPGDWKNLLAYTDPGLPDQFYVGFFAAHPNLTLWRYYQYDNVYVHAAP